MAEYIVDPVDVWEHPFLGKFTKEERGWMMYKHGPSPEVTWPLVVFHF